jgi:hypothetical protein
MPSRRSAFTPEALAAFAGAIEFARTELLADGIFSAAILDSEAMRTNFARKAFAFAHHGWSDMQIGQALARTFRNANSEARYQRAERMRQFSLRTPIARGVIRAS